MFGSQSKLERKRTRLGSEGIDVVNGKHLLLADTPDDFVKQIVRLSSSPELRRELGVNARKLVSEKYTWDSVGDRLLEACKAIL